LILLISISLTNYRQTYKVTFSVWLWRDTLTLLSWSSHVQSIYSKANSTLCFLRRNLRRCFAEFKESAYISLVRSTLEYTASVWDPHLAKDINKLENIQRRSARFVKGHYRTTSSVTQMWQDLQSRRRDLLYKVVMGHVGIQPENVGLVAADNRTRAKHLFKFRVVGSSTQAFRHSFAVRTVGDWNLLPSHVVEQSTTASFKAKLSRLTSAACALESATPHSSDTPRGGL